MNQTKSIIALICSLLLLTFCSKEEDFTYTQLISSNDGKSWLISEIIADTSNVTEDYPECVLDNERIFYADFSFEITEGDTVCSDTPDQSVAGSWQFNDIKTILRIEIDQDTTEYIINELGKNRMRLSFMDQKKGVHYMWTLVPE